MKLIIDIDEKLYNDVKEHHIFLATSIHNSIEKGIPYEERPQGEWIKIGDIGLAYTCNKCGEVNVISTNFCPNCGAKMQEGGSTNNKHSVVKHCEKCDLFYLTKDDNYICPECGEDIRKGGVELKM